MPDETGTAEISISADHEYGTVKVRVTTVAACSTFLSVTLFCFVTSLCKTCCST
jgi:hypothetical protein